MTDLTPRASSAASDPERPHLDVRDGRLRCAECGSAVSVGKDGTEYGHLRYSAGQNRRDRCSKRPKAVDPTGPGGSILPLEERSEESPEALVGE